MIAGQWRVGFSGVVSGDYAAWRAILETYGLWEPRIIEALRLWERVFLDYVRQRDTARSAYGDAADYAEWVEEQLSGQG